eukprot:1391887-Amorphochlora_amoeboformis.AAC.1
MQAKSIREREIRLPSFCRLPIAFFSSFSSGGGTTPLTSPPGSEAALMGEKGTLSRGEDSENVKIEEVLRREPPSREAPAHPTPSILWEELP